ncbi:MAG: NADH:flavin oxidoreductase [Acidobacteriota bacterium]|nr:NADH:flavin oxidoreductase [Acidobacteriota bacterium]
MDQKPFLHLGGIRDVETFRSYLQELLLSIPCDTDLLAGDTSPLGQPLHRGGIELGNRFAIQPMEGWDGTTDGRPTELTFRRWRRFGASGAKLIWGGEAVAVCHEGRANPNQLAIGPHSVTDLSQLRQALIEEHERSVGSVDGLVIGLQLTHSGRFSRPNNHTRSEPRILYRHPILDQRLGITDDQPLLADEEIKRIIEYFQRAAQVARQAGFNFVDIKHCHGYLGHEFLSAHTRTGEYGGSFENRTRFLREVVTGIRSLASGLNIGVRLSVFDTVPFKPDPQSSMPGKPGRGVPEPFAALIPYRWGFGVNPANPLEADLTEPIQFLALLSDQDINLVNFSAGSPYYNPHLQRPALYPPSDGYQPPEEPLRAVAQQMQVTRALKERFPNLIIIGSAYTYLQDFLPHVAQAAVREGWVDCVGLGRMVLSYPTLPLDVINGRALQRKRICRTFSDCTNAPRAGLPSGCYPLDRRYRESDEAAQLKESKLRRTDKVST